MKNTSTIGAVALAVVLLASVKVDADNSCFARQHVHQQSRQTFDYNRHASSERISADNVCSIIFCLIDAFRNNDFSVGTIINCVTANVRGSGNFAEFVVKNGENFNERGTIMNPRLSWGKWQVNGEDVDTVSNMEFDHEQAATFRASGRDGSPSGAEGDFEIHENGKKIAVVKFSIPYIGSNTLDISNTNRGYVCEQRGMTPDGSPTIHITCHKIQSGCCGGSF